MGGSWGTIGMLVELTSQQMNNGFFQKYLLRKITRIIGRTLSLFELAIVSDHFKSKSPNITSGYMLTALKPTTAED